MANSLYAKGRQAYLGGDTAWDDHPIFALLIDTAQYTVDLANHVSLADVPSAARIASFGPMTGKSITDGTARANPVTWPLVPPGSTARACILYDNFNSVDTGRWLIVWIDTAPGLPIPTNGSDIVCTWDSTNGIFKL